VQFSLTLSIFSFGKELHVFLNCFFFSDEEESPSFMRALAVRFQKYFNFARFVMPTLEDIRSIGLQDEIVDLPSLYVLVTPDPGTTKEISFNAIEYRPTLMGTMNYPNILQFLFTINHQFRYQLQGDNKSRNKTIMNMEDIIEIEQKRFEILIGGKKQTVPIKKVEKITEPEVEETVPISQHVKDEL
jgi:hypothetical protein